MKYLFSIILIIACASAGYSQYWFGPRVGFSYIDHNYQESKYEDTFKVAKNWNFQAGVAFAYTASDMYSVYMELTYDRIGKSVEDIATGGSVVKTQMTNHFISMPAMLRVTIGKVPFHYFVNGGPRISYWIAGKGQHFLEEFVEQLPDPELIEQANKDYKIVFKQSKVEGNDDAALVYRPNRLQFGLTIGGGMYFDIQGGSRLMIDARYTWVHSNMGLNSGSRDTRFAYETYRENFEYSHNIMTLGISYMFGYNSDLKRKGKSTDKESNKKKKK